MRKLKVFLITLILINTLFNVDVLAAESAFEENSSFNEDTSFNDSSFTSSFEESSSALSFEGELESKIRSFLEDSEIESNTILDLDLIYEKGNSEMKASINFDEDDIELEEGFIRLYYDNYDLEIGKMKVVWGKGDKLHVVDNLNGEDLTDFINPEYLERQIGQEMAKLNYYIGTAKLEAVYTPEFTPNKLAAEGNWVTSEVNQIKNLKSSFIDHFGLAPAARLEDEIMNSKSTKFEDGQFALRYTNSKDGYDYGFSFYQGKIKNPSMDQRSLVKLKQGGYDNSQIFLNDLDLHYDDVTVFGAEFSSVLAGINSRAEFAYYLTEDTSGDDPLVHNNKLAWIIGGDRDLPLHNMNLNLQIKSELILDKENVEDKEYDVDYADDYFTNMLVLKVSDKFKNETVLPELSLIYNLESADYILDNEVELKLKDDTSIKFNYKLFGGDDNETFGQFKNNDYLSVTANYQF
ncbi:hypothetical protein [Orenia marismortui]|uniref:Uncharacterized protein n=1 Tax=Orenia marismortui TaxID=46469 RepID=A0A4R8H9U7_9FIRM|nr:hypothetical protein [Orenia marismortui]TDX51948.1 hypothetical protein C7959_10972 [Orenia marismortui]